MTDTNNTGSVVTDEQVQEIKRIAADTPPSPAKWSAMGTPSTPPAQPTLFKPVNPVIGPQHDIPEKVDQDLIDILSWVRTHDSIDEYKFCAWLRDRIQTITGRPVVLMKDTKGVITYTVSRPDNKPSAVLFSSHVDTVDGSQIQAGVRKKLAYDSNFGHIMLDKDSIGGCLGADDGIGVWLMLKMIERKVPGTYVFHRGEECSGITSKLMASNHADWLKQFDIAVAFDRPRDNEVITHQRGGTECASDKFALALCERLNKNGMDYKPSKSGVYTDTYEYRKLIAECINIGVGYTDQHGRNETQDYAHAVALLDAVCAIDWDTLPVDRDPSKPDPVYNSGYSSGFGSVRSYGRDYGKYDDPDWWREDSRFPATTKSSKKKKKVATDTHRQPAPQIPPLTVLEEMVGMSYDDIYTLCIDDPEAAAKVISELLVELAKTSAESNMYKQLSGACANA